MYEIKPLSRYENHIQMNHCESSSFIFYFFGLQFLLPLAPQETTRHPLTDYPAFRSSSQPQKMCQDLSTAAGEERLTLCSKRLEVATLRRYLAKYFFGSSGLALKVSARALESTSEISCLLKYSTSLCGVESRASMLGNSTMCEEIKNFMITIISFCKQERYKQSNNHHFDTECLNFLNGHAFERISCESSLQILLFYVCCSEHIAALLNQIANTADIRISTEYQHYL